MKIKKFEELNESKFNYSINLMELFSLLSEKGYKHFEGSINEDTKDIHIYFSTIHNGRGDWCEIRIGEKDNSLSFINDDKQVINLINLSFDELLQKINNIK